MVKVNPVCGSESPACGSESDVPGQPVVLFSVLVSLSRVRFASDDILTLICTRLSFFPSVNCFRNALCILSKNFSFAATP